MSSHRSARSRPTSESPPFKRVSTLALVLAGSVAVWVQLATAQSPYSLEEAIRAQIELVESRPEDAAALKDLGNLYALAGHRDEAELAYREAMRIDSEDAGALFNLALLLRGRDPGEAIDLLRRATELDPGLAWAHYTLGELHQQAGRRTLAIAAFARAFRLDPDLALPDKNPHVIANPDATAALLKAAPRREVDQATPRSYADPQRIAALLIGGESRAHRPPRTAAEPSAEAPPAQLAPAPRPSSTSVPTAPEQTTAVAAAPEPRDSARSEVDPAPETAALPASEEGAARRTLRPEDLGSARSANQATPATPPSRNRARARGGARTAPESTRFRPGRRSSARLEIELRPRSLDWFSRGGG